MKRTTSIFLIAVLLITFVCTGCDRHDKIREPIYFYYRTDNIEYGTDSGVITIEIRDGSGHMDDYVYLTNMYLGGPVTKGCYSPFPAGTTLIRLDLLKDTALVILSSHISLLSGAELSIACTCLARTLLEMTDMKAVQIVADGDLLDGKESITIRIDDFVTNDSGHSTTATG